jgi:hypothetical protein
MAGDVNDWLPCVICALYRYWTTTPGQVDVFSSSAQELGPDPNLLYIRMNTALPNWLLVPRQLIGGFSVESCLIKDWPVSGPPDLPMYMHPARSIKAFAVQSPHGDIPSL